MSWVVVVSAFVVKYRTPPCEGVVYVVTGPRHYRGGVASPYPLVVLAVALLDAGLAGFVAPFPDGVVTPRKVRPVPAWPQV